MTEADQGWPPVIEEWTPIAWRDRFGQKAPVWQQYADAPLSLKDVDKLLEQGRMLKALRHEENVIVWVVKSARLSAGVPMGNKLAALH